MEQFINMNLLLLLSSSVNKEGFATCLSVMESCYCQ